MQTCFDLKQEAHLRWTLQRSRVNWEEFVLTQVRFSETYSEAKHQFSARDSVVLMNVQSPHKWWSTLALLCVSHTLQSVLESGQEARIVQIDFSAAFDRVNHQGILYKLSSVGIGGFVLSVQT